MKQLPKEFQFKCDEHSKEQCEMLGIEIYHRDIDIAIGYWGLVRNKILENYSFGTWVNSKKGEYPLISLSDYIDSKETRQEKSLRLLKEFINEVGEKEVIDIVNKQLLDNTQEEVKLKEKELIQHYAGQAMQGLLANSVNTSQYSKVVSDSIIIAKEMVAQLKEKDHL